MYNDLEKIYTLINKTHEHENVYYCINHAGNAKKYRRKS